MGGRPAEMLLVTSRFSLRRSLHGPNTRWMGSVILKAIQGFEFGRIRTVSSSSAGDVSLKFVASMKAPNRRSFGCVPRSGTPLRMTHLFCSELFCFARDLGNGTLEKMRAQSPANSAEHWKLDLESETGGAMAASLRGRGCCCVVLASVRSSSGGFSRLVIVDDRSG